MTDSLVSLREFIQAQFDSHNLLHGQHDSAHDREHKATDLAISKAEQATGTALIRAQEATDERFKAQNEWRSAMLDRERQFIQKSEYLPGHETLKQRLDVLEDAGIARTTREQERERAMARTMGLIGLAAAVGGFVLSLLTRLLGIGS